MPCQSLAQQDAKPFRPGCSPLPATWKPLPVQEYSNKGAIEVPSDCKLGHGKLNCCSSIKIATIVRAAPCSNSNDITASKKLHDERISESSVKVPCPCVPTTQDAQLSGSDCRISDVKVGVGMHFCTQLCCSSSGFYNAHTAPCTSAWARRRFMQSFPKPACHAGLLKTVW